MNQHTGTNHDTTNIPLVRQVSPVHVLRWLKLGWRDFVSAGWPSFLHGLIVYVCSIVILMITFLYWPILPGAVSGFILVGPILATGLYALSQRLEKNKAPRIKDVIFAWRTGSRCLLLFGSLLILCAAAWVGITTLLFGVFVKASITQPEAFLHYVFEQNELHFLLWTLLGGLGSALVYSLTVVSVPLLLDRDIETPKAMLTSIRAVGENPVTMGWWAIIILVATVLSILTLMIGFLIFYPVMGHASWHVYRDLVDAEGFEPRKLAD